LVHVSIEVMAVGAVLWLFGFVVGGSLCACLLLAHARRDRARIVARAAELERAIAVHDAERRASRERHEAEISALSERLHTQAEHHAQQLAAAESRVALVRGDREQLRDEMKAISADVLRQTGATMTREIAAQRSADHERAAGEIARRTEEIKRVVEPLGQKLGQVETKVEQLERERRESEGRLGEALRSLHEGVGSLAAQASNLTSALKRPSTRGSWGEVQLRNVIELAGMVEHCDFTEQTTIHTDDGRLRPDVLVRLPGGKLVVVDSKVPLEAFLAAQEAIDEKQRELALVQHARQTREHITKLASKGYQSQFDTSPELVVMFVPSEGIYHAALAVDGALLEYGAKQHVLIATPTTLIGLLRAIHYGWRQELIAASAREIADIGRELHRRLAVFAEPLAKVGRQLGSAVHAYNDAVGSFDRRVVPQMRRIEEAGAASEKRLPDMHAVEDAARPLTAGFERSDEAPLARLTPGDALDEVA
jgi:DNA recombination protein RmuC